MVKGLVIPFDPERPIEVREFNRLEDYQAIVGGWIEAVDVPSLGATIYVNEAGLLRRLSFNSRATFLWWYEVPERRQEAMLVGDALMVGLPDDDGASTDIPASALALLTDKTPCAVAVQYGDSPRWVPHPFPYDDYFEAVVWAMILTERVTDARAVKVLTIDQLLELEQNDGVVRELRDGEI